jgi:hypothetical protein
VLEEDGLKPGVLKICFGRILFCCRWLWFCDFVVQEEKMLSPNITHIKVNLQNDALFGEQCSIVISFVEVEQINKFYIK